MKKLLVVSFLVFTPINLVSIQQLRDLKRIVPTGVSPSQSQKILQQLKQDIQRKAPIQKIQQTILALKHSLQPAKSSIWKKSTRYDVPALPQVNHPLRSIRLLENALQDNASYEVLEQLLKSIESSI